MKFPNEPRKGESIAQAFSELLRWCRANNVVGIAGGAVRESSNGKTLVLPQTTTRTGGASAAALCPFGQIISYKEDDEPKKGIRGGIVYCGESNIEVPNQELNLDSDGDWLIWIEVECIANRDDDEEIFLPGMTSATAPPTNWEKVTWSESASYPDNTSPTVATGAGTIIIPIGRLKIKDGVPSLANTDCGHIRINQCAGILTHTRG